MNVAAFNTELISRLKLKTIGKFTALFLLCCLADFLFYGETFGISLPIFFFAANIFSIFTTRRDISKKQIAIGLAVTMLSVAPAVNAASWLNALIALSGTLWVSVYLRREQPINLEQSAYAILAQLIRLPFNFLIFIPHFRGSMNLRIITGQGTKTWKHWFLPLLLTALFLTLFSYANPIIGAWVSNLDFGFLIEFISFEKLLFWFLAACLSWPYVHPYFKKHRKKVKAKTSRPSRLKTWLDENNIAMTLVLFNTLFAVQTLLDITYIWNGAMLPDGVTYSEYVHQGTYILIFTSLLAALFILYVSHENRNYHANRFVKLMLLAWAAQNVLLVLSTMSRMEIYIADYSLTELRVWASVWMLLVIIGLILIFLRLLMDKSNSWLIRGNLISLIAISYVMGFTNLSYVIADYNLNIAKPRLVKIDTRYIAELGAETIPAIDAYLGNLTEDQRLEYLNQKLANIRNLNRDKVMHDTSGWRQWGYRKHRLQNYLKHKATNLR